REAVVSAAGATPGQDWVIVTRGIKREYDMGGEVVRALRGVDVAIRRNEYVAIMGPSGSGKSTLMNVIGCLDTPNAGEYWLGGTLVSKMSDNELAAVRNKQIGFVFQTFNLLPRATALQNVELPLVYAGIKSAERKRRATEALEKVQLGQRIHHKPNELSGGQQQRVAIARALVNQPNLILADEPTGNLDSKSSGEIIQLLRKMNDSGITVVMVTHEPDIARYAKRVITMKDGKVLTDKRRSGSGGGSRHAKISAPKQSAAHSTVGLSQVGAYYKQALKALLSNKVRSFLSILGVMIGVAAVIGGQAIGTGAQKSMEAALASLGTNLVTLRP